MGDINETLDSIHLCIQHSLLPSLLPLSLTSLSRKWREGGGGE